MFWSTETYKGDLWLRGGSALAMEALMACVQCGLSKLEIESDSLQIIRMLYGEWKIDIAEETIIFDIKQLVEQFQHCVFLYTPRHCNKASHKITVFVFIIGDIHTWDELWP
ncbi:hypothetical protein L3X38_030273 [Prunus dulcis]|uniref:RNase H type-1 domain-containing protein n=1 Tax=Prunus dulcis TaxID=3755 RepID=A0AAD4YSW9_PRUDU|nr:hypothetical protein L3X38_030273 [Prunus dulcis]